MTDAEALARWRQWAADMCGSQIIPGERWSDDDLRLIVIDEQEKRVCRILGALKFRAPEFADASD